MADYSGRLCVLTLSNGQTLMATSLHEGANGVTLNGPKICELIPAPKKGESAAEEKAEGNSPDVMVVFTEVGTRFVHYSRIVFVDTYLPTSLQDNLKGVYQKLSGLILN